MSQAGVYLGFHFFPQLDYLASLYDELFLLEKSFITLAYRYLHGEGSFVDHLLYA